jgi:phosphatidylinositol 4-kinase
MPLEGATVRQTEGGKYPFMFEVENHHYKYVIRARSEDDMLLWMKLLQGESEANALIPHIISADENEEEKKEDRSGTNPYKLSNSQQARYDFFKNERDFVANVCDVAEVLRFVEPAERKNKAPGLVREVKLPPCAYVPLCKSTDIWRRVDSVMADDTRVFNTNERCPMIYYFVAKRGERLSGAIGPNNPNLDVAEYLHMQFQVPDSEPLGKLEAIGEGDDHDDHEGQEITAIATPGSNLNEEENEDEFELTMEDPTDAGKGGVWEDDVKESRLKSSLSGGIDTSSGKGNRELQKFMKENFQKLPSKLAMRINRFESRRKMSYLDRNSTPIKSTPIVSTPIIETPIVECPSDDDSDVPSLDGRSVVSAGTGSIIFGDKVVTFKHADGIDKESLDRAKEIICGGESWAEKSARMLRAAEAGKKAEETTVFEVVTMMAKSHDDLRQEVFVMQMIHYFESVFAKSNIPLWLKTYRILSTSKSTGMIEVLVDATSIDGLKKSEKYPTAGGMRAYFEQVYGSPTSKSFLVAQRNFCRSLAGYSLVAYLLGLKDRHNGNIMIDTRGHIIHIDFGFAFGMAPGHEWSFERAAFKLTKDYINVMGGINSECFKEFQKLFVDGFKAARANSLTALGLVEIMMYKSNYPCFTGTRYGGGVSLKKFEKRLMLHVPDEKIEKKAMKLISNSIEHHGTKIYDIFQYYSNGLAV